nr:hypothetical protein Iba_chr14bCG17180 [Ipomoea batatas]
MAFDSPEAQDLNKEPCSEIPDELKLIYEDCVGDQAKDFG